MMFPFSLTRSFMIIVTTWLYKAMRIIHMIRVFTAQIHSQSHTHDKRFTAQTHSQSHTHTKNSYIEITTMSIIIIASAGTEHILKNTPPKYHSKCTQCNLNSSCQDYYHDCMVLALTTSSPLECPLTSQRRSQNTVVLFTADKHLTHWWHTQHTVQ